MCEDCCYKEETQEGIERNTTILSPSSASYLCVHHENFSCIYGDILLDSLGLLFTIMFAIHLCFVRKGLRKLRGSKKAQETDSLDPCHNKQCRVHAETVYIPGEGMSETCNTRFSLVSESVEDTRYLLNKTNQVLK